MMVIFPQMISIRNPRFRLQMNGIAICDNEHTLLKQSQKVLMIRQSRFWM